MKILVLGAGPAGARAAIRARELGADVTLLERDRVGGVAVNSGPAPVRTLARVARHLREARQWGRFGLRGDPPRVDLAEALANARRVSEEVHDGKGGEDFLRSTGLTLVDRAGPARFLDPHTVTLTDGRRFEGDRIILAVGGHSRTLPVPGGQMALNYADVFSLSDLPAHVAVVGGADTGCQLASIFRDFGVDVTILEFKSRLLPNADEDVSRAMTSAFQNRGIAVITNARVESLTKNSAGVHLRYVRANESLDLNVDAVFSAAGWPADLEPLNLAAAGIEPERGYVRVDGFLRSSVPHIYAAGDVNGIVMLAQSAALQGGLAAENALGAQRTYSREIVPSGSFTDPEYAGVGLTEAEARDSHDCATATVPYDFVTRALIEGLPEGFCKLIADRRTGQLLGAHVMGAYSAEVIQVAAVCLETGLRVDRVAELQLAFPTIAQALVIAAERLTQDLQLVAAQSAWDPVEMRPSFESLVSAPS